MQKNRSAKDWAALFLLVLFWGSSFAITKLALESISAEWIVFLRLFISMLILVPFAYIIGDGLPGEVRLWLWYIGLAIISSLLPFLLIAHGLRVVDSSLGAIFMGTAPLFVLIFAHIFLPDEKMDRHKTIGFLIGFIGIIALMNPQSLMKLSFQSNNMLGQIALLLGAMLYAAHMVATRFLTGSTPVQTMTGMSIIASILSFIYALWSDPNGLDGATTISWVYVSILGVFPTAIAGIILYEMIRVTGARFVSLTNYLLPVVGLIIGTFFLDEPIQLWAVIGMCLIVAGIWMSEVRGNKERP